MCYDSFPRLSPRIARSKFVTDRRAPNDAEDYTHKACQASSGVRPRASNLVLMGTRSNANSAPTPGSESFAIDIDRRSPPIHRSGFSVQHCGWKEDSFFKIKVNGVEPTLVDWIGEVKDAIHAKCVLSAERVRDFTARFRLVFAGDRVQYLRISPGHEIDSILRYFSAGEGLDGGTTGNELGRHAGSPIAKRGPTLGAMLPEVRFGVTKYSCLVVAYNLSDSEESAASAIEEIGGLTELEGRMLRAVMTRRRRSTDHPLLLQCTISLIYSAHGYESPVNLEGGGVRLGARKLEGVTRPSRTTSCRERRLCWSTISVEQGQYDLISRVAEGNEVFLFRKAVGYDQSRACVSLAELEKPRTENQFGLAGREGNVVLAGKEPGARSQSMASNSRGKEIYENVFLASWKWRILELSESTQLYGDHDLGNEVTLNACDTLGRAVLFVRDDELTQYYWIRPIHARGDTLITGDMYSLTAVEKHGVVEVRLSRLVHWEQDIGDLILSRNSDLDAIAEWVRNVPVCDAEAGEVSVWGDDRCPLTRRGITVLGDSVAGTLCPRFDWCSSSGISFRYGVGRRTAARCVSTGSGGRAVDAFVGKVLELGPNESAVVFLGDSYLLFNVGDGRVCRVLKFGSCPRLEITRENVEGGENLEGEGEFEFEEDAILFQVRDWSWLQGEDRERLPLYVYTAIAKGEAAESAYARYWRVRVLARSVSLGRHIRGRNAP